MDPDARVFAIAQNYPTHAKEVSGTEGTPAPVIFTKLQTSIVGPDEPVLLPPVTEFLDYEGEMAVVVGRSGGRLTEDQAAALVGGITCFNDVSARDLQWCTLGGKEIVDWFSGECLDRSTPLGPWVVTLDEAGDPADRYLQFRLNTEIMQNDRTSSMTFKVAAILSYISHRVRLRPGDIVATGTPSGVGRYRDLRLKKGDVMEVEVEGVGVLRNRVQSETQSKE